MGDLSPWHLLILAGVVVLLFGSKKLPDAARAMGRSLRIFKAETRGLREDEAAAGATAAPTAVAAAPAPVVEPATATATSQTSPTTQTSTADPASTIDAAAPVEAQRS